MKNNSGKFPYADVADRIQGRIEKGVFRISEKLPLLQVFCRETGSGMTTVFQACVELEKRGGGRILPSIRLLYQSTFGTVAAST